MDQNNESHISEPDIIFRSLTTKEIQEFKDWARLNFKPQNGMRINPLWHPVVREECKVILAEFNSVRDNGNLNK